MDNVLYSCDYTHGLEDQVKEEKTNKATSVTKEEETSEIIKTILHKKETACLQEYAHKNDKILCKCNVKHDADRLEEGWEGSAIIAHGSTITFGCLMFVFNTLNLYVDR